MHSSRKIIRAFLASPGDLQEERQAIRDVVYEFNESWANELGYQIELIGWEETVAGFGRPQQLINQELDRCDLFLGMIWKRWGTPPDHIGKFSSGFEEEFERSMKRCEETGNPEISLFFKQIPDEFMSDPGDDLKKVLEFRATIIAGKRVLFQNFSTVREVETLARKSVTAYVNRVRAEDELSDPDELQAKRARSGGELRVVDRERELSPLSAEGFGFLENLVDRIRKPDFMDTLSASDVARFRLLANLLSKPGNENLNLGVHDANILFTASTEGMKLGEKETRYLVRLGFQHFANENVPLWCWYSALADSRFNPAVVSSVVGVNENEKAGAISVLTALTLDLPADNDMIKRDQLIATWFSDDSPAKVRTAALGYLAKCGTASDLDIARKEYDRSDYGTSRNALECMIGILFRTGQVKAAQELVLESQFETLNGDILWPVVSGFEGLETPMLLLGLEHRNSQVRLHAMKLLHGRGVLDISMVERLTGDSDVLVRREALAALSKLGRSLVEEEIKKILIKPQKQQHRNALLSLRSAAGSDTEGEEAFRQYNLDVLKGLTEAELEKRVRASFIYDESAYFALVERYFKKHADRLRRDIDDKFSAYFEERIRQTLASFGEGSASQDLVKKTRDLEEFLRKKLTRQGLDILCAAQNREDLQRIRTNLRDGYTMASRLDAEYLGKHGEWIDIHMLVNAKASGLGAGLLTKSSDGGFQVEVARAIYSIGKKHSISDLLSLEMPAAILRKTIELCAESRFAKISRAALLTLLNHEAEEVRKAAAVLAVQALSVKQIRSVLSEYIGSGKHRYYNVIHWLDLGASMRREDARKVARSTGN